MKRCEVRLLWEPRDMWVGVCWTHWQHVLYANYRDVYVCLLPMVPLRIRWWRR